MTTVPCRPSLLASATSRRYTLPREIFKQGHEVVFTVFSASRILWIEFRWDATNIQMIARRTPKLSPLSNVASKHPNPLLLPGFQDGKPSTNTWSHGTRQNLTTKISSQIHMTHSTPKAPSYRILSTRSNTSIYTLSNLRPTTSKLPSLPSALRPCVTTTPPPNIQPLHAFSPGSTKTPNLDFLVYAPNP
jgi:hypothetical protein